MKVKVNSLLLVIGVFALFGMVFFSGYRIAQRKADRLADRINFLHKEQIIRYNITLDSLEYAVSEKEQLITTQKEAIRRGDLTREELRKLNIKQANEITRMKLQIDTLLHIEPETEVVYIDTCSGKPNYLLKLPYKFLKKDDYLLLSGEIDTRGAMDFGLSMSIPLNVVGGIEKKSKVYKVVITTPNPYVHVLSIQSEKLDVPSPKKWGIGVIGGYGFSLKRGEFSPFIGIGVSRNFIRF